ncbi:MAG: hypothetical protein JXR70_04195 [Spirochaetales bacterium]|nr:hypothetical protein [Spirochaetales bacterium]
MEKVFSIENHTFENNLQGDALYINMKKIRDDYDYLGLWYAVDRSEESVISTELYYSQDSESRKNPFNEEIKENTFKKVKKITLAREQDNIWIAMKNHGANYCRLKAYPPEQEKTYINYKVVKERNNTIDVLKKGILKGGLCHFFKLGVEDRLGKIDYNDTIFFVVFMKDCPPKDWHLDYRAMGVQKLPMVVSTFHFNIGRRYSPWAGQNPLEGI